jgi:chromosome segregation ATPase
LEEALSKLRQVPEGASKEVEALTRQLREKDLMLQTMQERYDALNSTVAALQEADSAQEEVGESKLSEEEIMDLQAQKDLLEIEVERLRAELEVRDVSAQVRQSAEALDKEIHEEANKRAISEEDLDTREQALMDRIKQLEDDLKRVSTQSSPTKQPSSPVRTQPKSDYPAASDWQEVKSTAGTYWYSPSLGKTTRVGERPDGV